MSLAVHLFITENISEESYRGFLRAVCNLFGKWELEESLQYSDDSSRSSIHECWIYASGVSDDDWFRINIQADRKNRETNNWPFEFEWSLSFETSAGRSSLGLAVQFGAWLMAMHRFRYINALDHDTCLKDEPTEFRTTEALKLHILRLLTEEFHVLEDLRRRRIVNSDGFLLLPLSEEI